MFNGKRFLIVHMKNTVKVLILSLLFYTFVYYITLITAVIVTLRFQQHWLVLDVICHIVAFFSTILMFTTYESRKKP